MITKCGNNPKEMPNKLLVPVFLAVAISSISGTLGGLVSGNLVWISLMRLVTGAGDWGTMVVAIVWSGEAAPHKQRRHNFNAINQFERV